MKSFRSKRALDLLQDALRRKVRETRKKKYRYRIPGLWVSPAGGGKTAKVQPFSYYLDVVNRIKRSAPPRRPKPTGGEWTSNAVIYNMFVRTTSAFDHDGNGALDLPLNPEGLRETGTFLKAIAMLPYMKRLGVNTVHLLPITAIGHDGNKGSLGSPYAIRNPYELDENLSEPLLGLDVKTEFKAFVEAAHRLGLRVVVEFVFRTAAKDADWVNEHPEWMYWIREEIQTRRPEEIDEKKYGSPIFTREELERIHHDVRAAKMGNLLPPHSSYRAFFTEPPSPDAVQKEGGKYIGTLPDGRRAKIPGAFADWPPDDNQPPWGDVTYLRLYNHSDFNYIAYNTIRMYDTRLTGDEQINRPLWDRIVGIIPYYQREFRIDGVMIDMGHALPMALKAEIVGRARSLDPDFAFWDENFSVTLKSREEGYNVVFGYVWVDQHHPEKMKALTQKLQQEGFPIPFFATPESHNTPRAAARPGGVAYAKWAMAVNAFLPAVPFLHSGYEIAERFPINTGLDFTNEELKRYPSERLPLFSEHAYDWASKEEFTSWVKSVLAVRARYRDLIVDPDPATFHVLKDPSPAVIAYARVASHGRKKIAVVTNAAFDEPVHTALRIDTSREQVVDILTCRKAKVSDGFLRLTLGRGECWIFEY
jgi:hypothetical protein